jgi:hypothetical protein
MEVAGQKDKFGHPMWYASKQGGFFWEQESDPKNSQFCDFSQEFSFSPDIITMKPNGPTDFGVGKNIAAFQSSSSNCGVNFSDVAAKGYMYKKDDARDIEFKTRIKADGISSGNGFSISVCTGHHSGSGCCNGFAYMMTTEITEDPSSFRFRKEMWHVSYHDSPEGDFTDPLCDFKINGCGKYVGIGLVRYNKSVSDDKTEDQVVLEGWFNPDPDNNPLDWHLLKKIIDKAGNGWGNDGGKCGGDKDQVGTWSNAQNRLKTNSSSGTLKFKGTSLREIDPLGSLPGTGGGGGLPTEQPNPPTTGTVYREWIMPYNIITFADNACSSGTNTTVLTPFYDVIDDASQSNLHRDRYRACMIANGSGSKFIGKKPRRVKAWLSISGILPSGEVTCVLRKNNTDDVAITFDLVAIDGVPATPPLDASLMSTTKKQYTFEALTAAYTWQFGDRLCIEYSGNTSDVINELNVFRNIDNPFDGTLSCAIKFDQGGPPPTSYSAPDVSRDYAWEISEVSADSAPA